MDGRREADGGSGRPSTAPPPAFRAGTVTRLRQQLSFAGATYELCLFCVVMGHDFAASLAAGSESEPELSSLQRPKTRRLRPVIVRFGPAGHFGLVVRNSCLGGLNARSLASASVKGGNGTWSVARRPDRRRGSTGDNLVGEARCGFSLPLQPLAQALPHPLYRVKAIGSQSISAFKRLLPSPCSSAGSTPPVLCVPCPRGK